ncbi:MAG: molybdenum cofactor biosynthesis protein MoaE [Phycisphaeraceae bacterium]|nr:molybdenum cofactor biosynthesis protein MoaE [Phycisphaeraceae bacterium]
MTVRVSISEGPLPAPGEAAEVPGAGADLLFHGLVRAIEDGRPILALEYEAYRPMADRQLERLCREIAERYALLCLECNHSVGRVDVGKCSFRLRVCAPHRAPALGAMGEFIDRLKLDVPIWKRPVWADAGVEAEHASAADRGHGSGRLLKPG